MPGIGTVPLQSALKETSVKKKEVRWKYSNERDDS
jgi:hypothetical protein